MFFWEVHELWRSVFESVAIFFDLWDSLISIWRHLRTFNLCMVGFSKLMDGHQKYIWKDDHSVTSRNSFLNDRAPKFWSTLRWRGPSGLPIYHHRPPIWFLSLWEKSMFPTFSRYMPSIRYSWWQCCVCDLAVFAELPLVALTMRGLRPNISHWCTYCNDIECIFKLIVIGLFESSFVYKTIWYYLCISTIIIHRHRDHSM